MKMPTLLIVLALSLLSHAATGQIITGGGARYFVSSDCAQDGRAGRVGMGGPVTGTPPYAARAVLFTAALVCQYPDVHYAVGADPTITYKDPSNPANLPAGWTYSGASGRLDCGGVSGTVLEGFDFGLTALGGGGISVGTFAACPNATIRNNKIVPPTSSCGTYGLAVQTNSPSPSIYNNTFDDSNNPECPAEQLNVKAGGTAVITYNRFVNVVQHDMSISCGSGTTGLDCSPYIRNNSQSRFGFSQGAHTNGIQFVAANGNTVSNTDYEWNYEYDPQPDTALSFSGNTASGVFTAGSPNVSVTVSGGQATDFLAGMTIVSSNLPGGQATVLSTNGSSANPVPLTLNANATANGTFTVTVPNAYPFGSVYAVRYIVQATGTATMTGGIISNNVFDGSGPIQGKVYAITCGADNVGQVTGTTISGNWFNLAGISGAAYTGGNTCPLTAAGNRNLLTGAAITIP